MKTTKTIHDFQAMACSIILCVAFFVLNSCSSAKQITIEVKTPAEVTLPVDVATIIVVNNSVAQPNNVGVSQVYDNQLLEGSGLDLTDLGFVAARSLFKRLDRARFFNEVYYTPVSFRSDNDWTRLHSPISLKLQNGIMDTLVIDGIIAIDRILFSVDEKVKSNAPGQSSESSHYVDLTISAQGSGSVYVYNKETPVHTFTVSDTLLIKETYYEDSLTVVKNIPEGFMINAANEIGRKIAHSIIPSWSQQDRYLYTGIGARMKEAYSYAKNKLWEQAREIWVPDYEKNTNSQNKIKIACSIAVSYEIEDRLDEALRWAVIAQGNLSQNKSKIDSQLAARTSEYVEILKKRIEDNRLINKQMGAD